MRDRVQESMAGAADTARQGYEALQQGYAEAERTVQSRPAQSMAVAFGLGMLAGVGVALLLRERPSESTLAKGRAASEQFGRHMLERAEPDDAQPLTSGRVPGDQSVLVQRGVHEQRIAC